MIEITTKLFFDFTTNNIDITITPLYPNRLLFQDLKILDDAKQRILNRLDKYISCVFDHNLMRDIQYTIDLSYREVYIQTGCEIKNDFYVYER